MDTTEYTGPSNIGTTRLNPQIEVYYKGASTEPSYRPTMTPDIVGRYVLARDYVYLAAKLAEVEEDRDDLLIALASARKQLELYIGEAEAALPAVYRLGLRDAAERLLASVTREYNDHRDYRKAIRALPTPTAAELMARIQTGEKK